MTEHIVRGVLPIATSQGVTGAASNISPHLAAPVSPATAPIAAGLSTKNPVSAGTGAGTGRNVAR